MEARISIIFLVMLLCVSSNGVNGKAISRETLSEVNKRLKLLNKPAVKTIKSEDGDVIDCVDIYKQPAFDHPALKNHTIQLRPSFDPSMEASNKKQENSWAVVSQTWKRSGSCPKGTVPIRRVRKRDLLRAISLGNDFGRKNPLHFKRTNKTAVRERIMYFNNTKAEEPTPENRSTAILWTYGYHYIGASGDINVWNPYVEKPPEFSTAQIWLKVGPFDDFESVEAGWQVNFARYGDTRTRFFTYWTVDGYKKTGCFDLTCSNGFVQTSPEIAVGGAIEPGSSSLAQQYVIPVNIFLDIDSGNWWLQYHNISVGYWPGSLFSSLTTSATIVEWGGEVYSTNVLETHPHTKTHMGSGYEAGMLYGYACFIAHARIMDYSKTYKYPEWVNVWTDEYNCYTGKNHRDGEANRVEAVFYFGGPGQSERCP